MHEQDDIAPLISREEFVPMSPLSVNVDLNDLIADYGEEKAYEIVGKLKDLLA